MTNSPRVGVYVCHCSINIAATVDVAAVTNYAAYLPGVAVARNYTYMCSDPGQALIKNDIAEHHLNRVVVASCSPRMHEPTFRADIPRSFIKYFRHSNLSACWCMNWHRHWRQRTAALSRFPNHKSLRRNR